MARIVAVLGMTVASASPPLTREIIASNAANLWRSFKAEYGRQYNGDEEGIRFDAFVTNMMRAAEIQENNPQATFGFTEFTDKTSQELKAYTDGYEASTPCPGLSSNCCEDPPGHFSVAQLAAAPDSVDWREQGAVTSVKDQGSCGSCWAFAAAGTVEGQWAAAGHPLVDVSVQELVSCNSDDLGCSGGRVDTTLRWLARERSGNMVTEESYPYVAASGVAPLCADKACWALSAAVTDDWCTSNCKAPTPNCPAELCSCNGTNPHAQIAATVTKKACQDLPKDEDQLAMHLAESGPFAVALNADTWTSYKGGIMTDCPEGTVSHGVLVVGYGSEAINGNQTKFWIIKNSWGKSWGEDGYIRLAYGSDLCSLTYRPITALVDPASGPISI